MSKSKTIEEGKLVVSLLSLVQFCQRKAEIDSGSAFIDFYEKVCEAINNYARQKPSRYFAEKFLEMPKLTIDEIDTMLALENRSNQNYGSDVGGLAMLIVSLLTLVGLIKDKAKYSTEDKLNDIVAITNNLLYVLQHPGFEELYYHRKQ